MVTCERCHTPIPAGSKAVRARRGSGQTATICTTCAAELRSKGRVKPPPQQITQKAAAEPVKANNEDSGTRWYKTLGGGFVFLAGAILLYFQLSGLEAGTVSRVRVPWPIVFVYQMFGLWGVVSCFGVFALIFFGWGIAQLFGELGRGS
ncbi:MAG: hypothetical protein QNJ45_17025 [Ardenticatenaceae bacterium]|nr:hypothetical protein [Ardenticatenaceae bacterium]